MPINLAFFYQKLLPISIMGSFDEESVCLAVDSKRAELGAIQNRMESAICNQANVAENEADRDTIPTLPLKLLL